MPASRKTGASAPVSSLSAAVWVRGLYAFDMEGNRLRRHLGRLGRFVRSPLGDQLLGWQAFILLGVSRARIKRAGMAGVQADLGQRMTESSHELSASQVEQAKRVAWAIRGVRVYCPWVSNCFPQAVTAHRLLARRGISSTLYLGATKGLDAALPPATSEFAAHAWVRSGEVFVTGGDTRDAYTPIVWFCQPPAPRVEACRTSNNQ